jgi:hypothetical protein
MSATTVFGRVGSDRASIHSKRNAVIVFTVIALFAVSFFVGRTTAPTHARLAPVATHAQLSPANSALIANDVAPVTPPLSQANTASCVAGRPC